jgi:hypothetical protein
LKGLAGFATDRARETSRTVSQFAGLHIGLNVQAEAVKAARGEAPRKGNTMKLSAIRAWGMAVIAAIGLMGATARKSKGRWRGIVHPKSLPRNLGKARPG